LSPTIAGIKVSRMTIRSGHNVMQGKATTAVSAHPAALSHIALSNLALVTLALGGLLLLIRP